MLKRRVFEFQDLWAAQFIEPNNLAHAVEMSGEGTQMLQILRDDIDFARAGVVL